MERTQGRAFFKVTHSCGTQQCRKEWIGWFSITRGSLTIGWGSLLRRPGLLNNSAPTCPRSTALLPIAQQHCTTQLHNRDDPPHRRPTTILPPQSRSTALLPTLHPTTLCLSPPSLNNFYPLPRLHNAINSPQSTTTLLPCSHQLASTPVFLPGCP